MRFKQRCRRPNVVLTSIRRSLPCIISQKMSNRMKKGRITRFKLDPKKPPNSDWRAFDAMTEEPAPSPRFGNPTSPATRCSLRVRVALPSVRALREKLNLTQEAFAARFHLPPTSCGLGIKAARPTIRHRAPHQPCRPRRGAVPAKASLAFEPPGIRAHRHAKSSRGTKCPKLLKLSRASFESRHRESILDSVLLNKKRNTRRLLIASNRAFRDVSVDRVKERALIIVRWLETKDPRQAAHSFKHSRDVPIFEFDGATRSPGSSQQRRVVVGFYIRSASEFIAEHDEIIRDDRVQFVRSPVCADFALIRHTLPQRGNSGTILSNRAVVSCSNSKANSMSEAYGQYRGHASLCPPYGPSPTPRLVEPPWARRRRW